MTLKRGKVFGKDYMMIKKTYYDIYNVFEECNKEEKDALQKAFAYWQTSNGELQGIYISESMDQWLPSDMSEEIKILDLLFARLFPGEEEVVINYWW